MTSGNSSCCNIVELVSGGITALFSEGFPPVRASSLPKNLCNFFDSAAYFSMDATRNRAKEPGPQEGKIRQMEGLDLESVIERARGHDAEALGEIYRRYVRRVFGLCRYML